MYSLLQKRGQLFAIVLGVGLSALYLITVFSGLGSEGYDVGDDLNQVLKNDPSQSFSMFDFGIGATLTLIFVGLAAAVLFGIYHVLTDIKGSMKGLIAVGVLLALFFILYSSAGTDFNTAIHDTLMKFEITEGISKMVSGAILTGIIMAAVAFFGAILLEIYNFLR